MPSRLARSSTLSVLLFAIACGSAGPPGPAPFVPTTPAPESVAPQVMVGVAMTAERIESPGDIDEFYISGEGGAEWIVFIRSGAPHPRLGVRMWILDSLTGQLITSTNTPASYEQLEAWSTGRFFLPRTGTYLIRLRGDGWVDYAFRVDAIDRAAESLPATFAIGDTIDGSIERVGDIDTLSFQGVAGEEVNVSLRLEPGMSPEFSLELLYEGVRIQNLDHRTPLGPDRDRNTGRFALPGTGPYTVRISGPFRGVNVRKTGEYRIEVARINRRPENGATLRLDAPPLTGAIDRIGDVDEYEITGTAGQLVVMHLKGETGHIAGVLLAQLHTHDGARLALAAARTLTDSLGTAYSRRVTLPHTGTYRVTVQGNFAELPIHGAYTLEAYTVSPAPEHIPSTITIGQVVAGERIDRPGDLDVFTFQGTAGGEANVFVGWSEPNEELFAQVAGVSASVWSLDLDARPSPSFPLKDSTYTITVDPHGGAQDNRLHSAGPYAFRVFPIDRRPESRPATYVLGDTISTEVLYPTGDIDEYAFELGEPTTLELFWDAPYSLPHLSEAVRARVFAAGRQEEGDYLNVVSETLAVRSVSLPAGRYVMVVSSERFPDTFIPRSTLQYRFALGRKASP